MHLLWSLSISGTPQTGLGTLIFCHPRLEQGWPHRALDRCYQSQRCLGKTCWLDMGHFLQNSDVSSHCIFSVLKVYLFWVNSNTFDLPLTQLIEIRALQAILANQIYTTNSLLSSSTGNTWDELPVHLVSLTSKSPQIQHSLHRSQIIRNCISSRGTPHHKCKVPLSLSQIWCYVLTLMAGRSGWAHLTYRQKISLASLLV